ncbi:peptidyl-prolyl cis-trans isomerase-like 4 [Striga asiatica]|uniref:Peptidyl-prolyl cis-trans isomerase-like 4 n=1 Tax=Striga asiatica TaxID=4170 RepID=A0A5A7PNJ9_STRAF|nr:peptidyl-prolyl cis-trans isomerase-like 4 [Striga asiatica]
MFTGGKSFVSSPPAFSNDAKRLLLCTGNKVSIFSTSTGLQTSELDGHEAQVTSVIVVPATTPASKLLCYCWTSSLDGKIKYWDFAAPELMRTIDIRLPIHSMVAERDKKVPDLYAYIYAEDVKQKEEQSKSLCGQIRKCNLTKSRLIGGVTLAETRNPGSLTISPTGKYIGIHEKRKLRIWEIPAKDSDSVGYKKIRLHHTKVITALAFHPTERVVAAGDVTGRILIWRGVGRGTFGSDDKSVNGKSNKNAEDRPGVRDDDDADSCTTWHWHSAQVNVLFFSSDGAYLYSGIANSTKQKKDDEEEETLPCLACTYKTFNPSGGKEGVLVVWQLDTGKKKFLPRIGSPLVYFVNSPDPSMSTISCADNQILFLRMPTMEILRSISGIKLRSSQMEMYEGFGSNIVFNNTSGLIAVPTENYRVQFYDLFSDRAISEVQIYERNYQPGDEITKCLLRVENHLCENLNSFLVPDFQEMRKVKVNLVALSPDGSTMSTVETRFPEDGIGSLVSLKFWACGSRNKQVRLSTVIYEPHRIDALVLLAFPTRYVTCIDDYYSKDKRLAYLKFLMSFMLFAINITGMLESPPLPSVQLVTWLLVPLMAAISRKKPMTSAAFSRDGSVLAVAGQEVITLWDPDRNALLAVIGDSPEVTFHDLLLLVISPHFQPIGSNPRLNMWSMSKLRTTWSYRLDTEAIACSMDNSTFAVLVLLSSSKHTASAEVKSTGEDGMILLFNAENPVPLSTWFVSKAQCGRLGFVQLSSQLDDKVPKTEAANEVLAYVNGANEYVLLNPNGDLASELSISCQQNFSSLEETGKCFSLFSNAIISSSLQDPFTRKFGYASIYGELPEFSLKTNESPFLSVPSDGTWKTIFSGPSHKEVRCCLMARSKFELERPPFGCRFTPIITRNIVGHIPFSAAPSVLADFTDILPSSPGLAARFNSLLIYKFSLLSLSFSSSISGDLKFSAWPIEERITEAVVMIQKKEKVNSLKNVHEFRGKNDGEPLLRDVNLAVGWDYGDVGYDCDELLEHGGGFVHRWMPIDLQKFSQAVQNDFTAQTGDPTGTGSGGDSVYNIMKFSYVDIHHVAWLPNSLHFLMHISIWKGSLFLSDEIHLDVKHSKMGSVAMDVKHSKMGSVAMASTGENVNASQFYITLQDGLDYLDGKHAVCIWGVAEGLDTLTRINEEYVDEKSRQYKNIRHYLGSFHIVIFTFG